MFFSYSFVYIYLDIKKRKDYLRKAKRGEEDRVVNAALRMVDKTIGKKSDGTVCFVFGNFILFLRLFHKLQIVSQRF